MIEPWLDEIVTDFWGRAGTLEQFPRDLEEPILWALPIAVFKLPRLWLTDVGAWLKEREISARPPGTDRPLRACLVAHEGKGIILLDVTDDEAERRFSLAHDIAHFLLDYLLPRQLAIRELGPQIIEVLDGHRRPTVEERVNAMFTRCQVGPHLHLMDRLSDGLPARALVAVSERRADRLALELLAPAEKVRECASNSPEWRQGFYTRVRHVVETLSIEFGLPCSVAEVYADWLVRQWTDGPSVREWLGIVPS